MKKVTAILAILICFVITGNATILIVDKNPTAPTGSYGTVNDAVTAASTGDTLYIIPASSDYGSFNLSKQLVVMGNGHYPVPYNDYPWISQVIDININNTNATGSSIIGLRINKVNCYSNVSNITIEKNRIYSDISVGSGCPNWTIKNNLFTYYYTHYYTPPSISIGNNINWLIENNIFSGTRTSNGTGVFIINSNSYNVVISNNIFIGDSLATGNYVGFDAMINAIITNNIFYYRAPLGCTYCNMSNNLTYMTSQDTLPYGNNTGANNIIGQDPLFVDAPQQSHTFLYNYDYHLGTGSPGINAGTDGTNIGIYGGTYPYSDIVPIPKIQKLQVQNPKVPLNDTLRVRIKAINY